MENGVVWYWVQEERGVVCWVLGERGVECWVLGVYGSVPVGSESE